MPLPLLSKLFNKDEVVVGDDKDDDEFKSNGDDVVVVVVKVVVVVDDTDPNNDLDIDVADVVEFKLPLCVLLLRRPVELLGPWPSLPLTAPVGGPKVLVRNELNFSNNAELLKLFIRKPGGVAVAG